MKKARPEHQKVSKIPKVIFVLGLLVLMVGAGLFIYKQVAAPATADATFLVAQEEWTREDEPGVIWTFTGTGTGKLTTDNHATDYDFTWEIKDDKLTITTEWLYDLSDEFTYVLDQGAKVLTITVPGKDTEIKFKAE